MAFCQARPDKPVSNLSDVWHVYESTITKPKFYQSLVSLTDWKVVGRTRAVQQEDGVYRGYVSYFKYRRTRGWTALSWTAGKQTRFTLPLST